MTEIDYGVLAGPREAFERFRDMMLAGGSMGLESLLADDGVVEAPFAPPGAPRRFEGRDAFVASGRACRTHPVHGCAQRRRP